MERHSRLDIVLENALDHQPVSPLTTGWMRPRGRIFATWDSAVGDPANQRPLDQSRGPLVPKIRWAVRDSNPRLPD